MAGSEAEGALAAGAELLETALPRHRDMLRAAANLLNRKKVEYFRTFDGDSVAEIQANPAKGKVDESERESEQSGSLFQITLRATF